MGTHIKSISAEKTWPLRHTVMWPSKPFSYIKLPKDEQGLHFGLFLNEELVSTVSLFIIQDVAQFRKLATRTSEQGKGYGSQLLNYTLTEAQRKGVKNIWCNARKDKTKFYRKFGFSETPTTFSKGNITYVIMEKITV
jgi:predicted GNAT family N-acyltransferase